MSYSLFWRSPALPFAQKQTAIAVPAGALVSNKASIRFTGKGASNYGKIQQENLIRLLENFAGDNEPDYPTVGQLWYDTDAGLKVCTNTPPGPVLWAQLKSTQVTGIGDPPPSNPALSDTWFSLTGSASGVLYVYTGVGRYPGTPFNAYTAGYWPVPAVIADLNVILNASTYGAANTNYSEVYIHGATAGTPSNVNGTVLLNGVPTTVTKGPCFTAYPVQDGLIVVDPSSTLASVTAGAAFFCVRRYDDGRWFYDNNVTLVEFTPTAAMYAIGVMTVVEQDDNTPPGVIAATMWSEARYLTNIVQSTESGTGIGGWEQIWPAVETHGGRIEYEYMYGLLARLIGDQIAFGGSGAAGKSIPFLTNFGVLDASMQAAYLSTLPVDSAVRAASAALNMLKVDPNSQDWDALLAAARYAVSRLEMPAGTASDIAVYPFVQDGLPGHADVAAYPLSDSRALPVERGVRSRAGTLTILSSYQETSNILRGAVNNRYVLAGVLGGSGVTTFGAGTSVVNQASFAAPGASLTGTVSHGIAYEFLFTNPDIEAFFYSGAALEFVMTHTPGGAPTAVDTSLQALTNANGRFRITADKTYVMTPAPVPVLSAAVVNTGFEQSTLAGVVLTTMSNGLSSIVVRMVKETGFRAVIYIDITSGGVATGSFSVLWRYVYDGETYLNPGVTQVYPAPATHTGTLKRGSGVFV